MWLRSWKVYTFILLALGAVSRARLERYRDKVVTLTGKYGKLQGDSWWIIALADQRMRAERMERIGRELETKEDSHPGSTDMDRAHPWGAVFLAAANGTAYWQAPTLETST